MVWCFQGALDRGMIQWSSQKSQQSFPFHVSSSTLGRRDKTEEAEDCVCRWVLIQAGALATWLRINHLTSLVCWKVSQRMFKGRRAYRLAKSLCESWLSACVVRYAFVASIDERGNVSFLYQADFLFGFSKVPINLLYRCRSRWHQHLSRNRSQVRGRTCSLMHKPSDSSAQHLSRLH